MKRILYPILFLAGCVFKLLKLRVRQNCFTLELPHETNPLDYANLMLSSNYEKDEILLVRKYIRSSDKVLELGACIGAVSLTLNDIILEKEEQVSVEPNPAVAQILERNRDRNSGRFHIEQCILTRSKEVTFFPGGQAFLSSSTKGNSGKRIAVIGRTLEDLADQYFSFSALIMDIEGSEIEFFREFDLRKTKIRLIIWEAHAHIGLITFDELKECYSLLESYGFCFRERQGNVECWSRTA